MIVTGDARNDNKLRLAYLNAAEGYFGGEDDVQVGPGAQVELCEDGAWIPARLWLPAWAVDRYAEMQAMRTKIEERI